eukprot:COSAG03_NODE_814_length_5756_cov_5.017324_4_plen_188_part_00
MLYPFGWGLSYANFSFAWSNTPPHNSADVVLPTTSQELAEFSVEHSVVATNTGTVTSDVVALAFIVRPPDMPADTDMPLRKLFGFERFRAVPPGESRTAYFAPDAQALGVVDQNGDRMLQPGSYVIECGDGGAPQTLVPFPLIRPYKANKSSPCAGVATKASRTLTLTGEPVLVERSSEWVKAAGGY